MKRYLRSFPLWSLLLGLWLALVPAGWSAVDFDGTDDWIDLGAVSVGAADFTVSAWIRRDAAGAESIFDNEGGAKELGLDITAADKLHLWCNAEGATGATALNAATWYHVAATRSGTGVTLYVNGSSDGTGTNGNDCSGTGARIGAFNDAGGNGFDGLITDVRIYSRALSAVEILELASARLKYHDITGAVPLGYWPLDDCVDGASGDLVTFIDRAGAINGTGDNGANNTGLTCRGESNLMYPWGTW